MPKQHITQHIKSLLAIVFLFSGFASLVYQVVWQRLLTLHYGVSAVSTTLIVGVYMAGLGLGGLVGGYLAEKAKNRLMLYVWAEAVIGVFGLFSLAFMDYLGRATAGSPYVLSAVYMFAFLCLPTFLMGITLPVLTKIFNRLQRDFFKTVSFLYFINTIGAAAGALAASYGLISFLGLDGAVIVAALIDLALAGMVWLACRLRGENGIQETVENGRAGEVRGGLGRWAFVIVFVTGFLALGYEIVWYRLIGVLVKDSPYAFSTILAVYLLGVALGSLWANRAIQRRPTLDRRGLFFGVQFLIGLSTLVLVGGYYYLTRDTAFGALTRLSFANALHPNPELIQYLPKHIGSFEYLYSYLDIFLWPLLLIFLPTFFMGAGFPLISSLAVTRSGEEGKVVGTVYFFNILGNVAGSILTGFVFLPALGSELTLLGLAGVNLTAVFFLRPAGNRGFLGLWRPAVFIVVAGAALAVFPRRGDLFRLIHPPAEGRRMILSEGIDAVVVSYFSDGRTTNYINGLEHGVYGTDWYNGWVAAAVGYAPAMDDVLVIGFGSGTFPAVLEKADGLKHLTVVELCPSLMANMEAIPFYEPILKDARLNLVIEDGRRYLLQSRQQYDVIIMDPLRTTTSYANNLHALQFFELAKSRLKPGGILLIGGLNDEWVVPKTVAQAFAYVEVYDQFTVGSDSPLGFNGPRMADLFAVLPAGTGEHVTGYFRKTYRGNRAYLLSAAQLYPIDEQYQPVTEFYLGLRIKERLHLIHEMSTPASLP